MRAVPGSHEGVFVEPNVKALAQALASALNEVQGPKRNDSPVDALQSGGKMELPPNVK